MATDDVHTPVLLERSVELLAPALGADGAVLVDATLGLGGHAEAFLGRFPDLRLVGIDRDEEALERSRRRLAPFGDRATLVHAVYDELAEVLADRGARASGILFDLGVSSMQLDRDERGFAYSRDAPLDMRMDAGTGPTAATILADYDERALARLFRVYGEEKLAARYARSIVASREREPLERSGQLVSLIEEATPAALRRSGHPAKRVFQALRIEVNAELEVLERAIPAALGSLGVGGRLVVLSYHSLEDRIVKRALAAASTSSAPADLPVEWEEHRPDYRLLTRGAEQAGEAERATNPRAASVRLRAAERVRGAR